MGHHHEQSPTRAVVPKFTKIKFTDSCVDEATPYAMDSCFSKTTSKYLKAGSASSLLTNFTKQYFSNLNVFLEINKKIYTALTKILEM